MAPSTTGTDLGSGVPAFVRWMGAIEREQKESTTGRGWLGCSCSPLRLRLLGEDVVLREPTQR